VLLRGPRQVGKTTLLVQVIHALLDDGVAPERIFRVQFDELPDITALKGSPILELSRWYAENILRKTMNQAALDNKPAYIFLDEVQNLPNWGPQFKQLVDIHHSRALLTGSSAFRFEIGKDSLAGRVQTLDMGPLFLREIAEIRQFGKLDPFLPLNGLAPLKEKTFWLELREFGLKNQTIRERAFEAFSERGAYPVSQVKANIPWEEIGDQLNEMVIRRAIQHDLRLGVRGRKRDEHLLEELFRFVCRYIGQYPSSAFYVDELKKVMNADISWNTILPYLRFLDMTLLIGLIEPLELRLKGKQGLLRKLCLCDHALRAAWLQEVIPLTQAGLEKSPHLSDLAGHIAESAAGYFLKSITGLDVAHFPTRGSEPEVDFIITIGEQRIPVEIKYKHHIDYKDTHGLRSFIDKAHYNAPFGLCITLREDVKMDDPRIVPLPLSTLLFMR
jgi:predicted AAA+ superfamily ATPase